MKTFWVRIHEIANQMGLICGAIALDVTGRQIQNQNVINAAGIALIIFLGLFIINAWCLVRDILRNPNRTFGKPKEIISTFLTGKKSKANNRKR